MEKKLYNTITEWAWTNKLCVAELIGYAAAFCGTVSLIPQIIKLWKERSAKAISATMYLIYTFGVVLWLIYGIMRLCFFTPSFPIFSKFRRNDSFEASLMKSFY